MRKVKTLLVEMAENNYEEALIAVDSKNIDWEEGSFISNSAIDKLFEKKGG